MVKFKSNKSVFVERTSVALSSLVLSTSLLLSTTAPLKAADFTVQDGQTETNQTITLSTGDTGTVLQGGTIQDSTIDAITATGNVTIDNAGTIVTTGGGGDDGVHHTAGILALFNRATGTITGVDDGVEGDVITLTNWGSITGDFGVFASSSITSFINTGTITGTGSDGVSSSSITSLINSGIITSADDGVYSSGTVTSLTNTGTISGTDDGVSGGTITSLINSGIIKGTGNKGVDATALTNLTNSGTITGGDDAVFSSTSITSLINSGTITGVVDGVQAVNALTSLDNSGTITGGTYGVTSGSIDKLINSGKITGGTSDGVSANSITSLTNSGTITGGDEGVFGSSISTLINSGTITGTASNAVRAAGTLSSLINSGTIKGQTVGVTANTLTSLVNSGTITGATNFGVAGIFIVDVVNSGTITGTGGVIANASITNFINSGTIKGTVTTGVGSNTSITNLTNSGTISSVTDGVQSGAIISLTNSGKITGGNFSIRESGAADTLLTLLPGSDIFGAINLGGGTNTLDIGNGLSTDLLFTGAAPQAITTNGAPSVTVGTRVVTFDPTALAQQDDLMFDLSSGILGTVFSQLNNQASSGAATVLSYAATGSAQSSAIEANFGDDGNDDQFRMWAKAFGSRRNQQGTTGIAGATHNVGGLVIGLDSQIDSTTSLGAFFGASKTDVATIANQQESDVKSFFGGFYAGFVGDNITVNLGITGGKTDHQGTRLVDNNQINGVETALRTFDGTFIAPEIAVSSQYDVGGTLLQPTLSVGYTGMFLDGYTETGTSAPLTVASRDMHLLHARIELAALLNPASDGSVAFAPYIGVEGRSLIGGKSVDATLLGQSLSFAPGGSDNIASIFVGTRVAVMQTEDLDIFAGFEGSYDTEQSSTITGNLEFKWQF